jgi:PAS domain S-box-containing protein
MARLEQRPPTTLETLSKRIRDLPVAALVTDKTGAYVIANAVASRLTGYSADELRSMSVWDVSLPVQEHETDVLWRNFVHAGTQRGTVKLKRKNGTVVSARYVAKSNVLPGFHISLLQRAK